MNWLDLVLAIVLAGSTAAGLAKGFARTVVGIVSTIVGLVVATWFYGAAGGFYREYVSSKAVSNFLGFATVFLLVILAGALLGRLLELVFKWAGISWLDRILGGCFGLARGLLVAVAIVMMLMSFSMTNPPDSVANSAVAPYVLDAAHLFSKMAPRELTDGFQRSYDTLRDAAKTLGGKRAAVPNTSQF